MRPGDIVVRPPGPFFHCPDKSVGMILEKYGGEHERFRVYWVGDGRTWTEYIQDLEVVA